MHNDGSLFANRINKKINNNENIYYSKNSEKVIEKVSERHPTKNIYQKINDIFKSRDFIYKADVVLKTKSGELEKRIVGRNSQYLITSENELIPIVDILDIKKKTV